MKGDYNMIGKINADGIGTSVDLSLITAVPNKVLQGEKFIDKTGNLQTGNIASLGGSTIYPSYDNQVVATNTKYMTGNITIPPVDNVKILMNNKVLYEGFDFASTKFDIVGGYTQYFKPWYNNSDFYQMNRAISTVPLNLVGYRYISILQTNWSAASWLGKFWISISAEANKLITPDKEDISAYCLAGGSVAAVDTSWFTLYIPEAYRVNGIYYLKFMGNNGGQFIGYINKVILHNKMNIVFGN